MDGSRKEILFEKEHFDITPVTGLARPWVFTKIMPASGNNEYNYVLGNQYLNKGDLDKAKAYLERAYQKEPSRLKYALSISDVLFRLKEYRKVKQTLIPFLNIQEGNFEFLKLLGKSSQALQEYQEAIPYYKEYLNRMGTNLQILNAIGTCYYQLGDMAQALVAWERSLEINPNQERLKEIISSIKGEKNEK